MLKVEKNENKIVSSLRGNSECHEFNKVKKRSDQKRNKLKENQRDFYCFCIIDVYCIFSNLMLHHVIN